MVVSRSWAEIDHAAVAANVAALRAVAGDAQLCAVVKADGYGHGAIEVARTALVAGATVVAVAQTDEAVALRDAGVEAPIWLLSEPTADELATLADHGVEPAVYSPDLIDRAANVGPMTVHLGVDTGMGRVGAAPLDAVDLARRIVDSGRLRLGSVWTHLACADDPEADAVTNTQLTRYRAVLRALDEAGIDVPLRHAANSAGAIAHPAARFDLVRCGIALYGLPPSPALDGRVHLRPALRWVSEVSFVKRVAPGASVSYGHRFTADAPTTLATIPVGYADGLPRSWWRTGEVLIDGPAPPHPGRGDHGPDRRRLR